MDKVCPLCFSFFFSLITTPPNQHVCGLSQSPVDGTASGHHHQLFSLTRAGEKKRTFLEESTKPSVKSKTFIVAYRGAIIMNIRGGALSSCCSLKRLLRRLPSLSVKMHPLFLNYFPKKM